MRPAHSNQNRTDCPGRNSARWDCQNHLLGKTTVKMMRKTKSLMIRPYQYSDYKAWRQAHESFLPPQNTWDMAHGKPESLGREVFAKALRGMVSDKARDYSYVFGIFSKDGE